MKTTSRRVLLTGMVGLVAAPQAASSTFASTTDAADTTVAEERFARMIAAAHAPDVTCARQAERYAERNWREYVTAARAVLSARG
ncbi:hypothetical protein Q3C01_14875 [Bradyrhizobium sp. UFLA05-109]